jgi:antitoxin VapB
MASKTAKLFVKDGGQAVHLPVEFRFDGLDEVFIRRDTVTGDVILSPRPPSESWKDFFALRDDTEVPAGFMDNRPLNLPLIARGITDDR